MPAFRTPEILRGLVGNTTVLLGERILRAVIGLVVGIYVARYLGPEGFGALSYAISYVGLFTAFSLLGLPRIVVRELVNTPEQTGTLLGTAFGLMTVGGLFALALMSVTLLVPDISTRECWMIIIIGAGAVFQAINVIEYYLQATQQIIGLVKTQFAQLLLSSLFKIALLVTGARLEWFAAAWTFDSVFMAGALYLYYRACHAGGQPWRFSRETARRYLHAAWPLILTMMAVTLYMKIDQIMIREMLDAGAVGQYAAAVRLSEAWYFIPVAITTAVFPSIVRARENDTGQYARKMQSLFNLMVWLALAVAVPVTLSADRILLTLFGTEYAAAAPVLSVHIWAAVFVFINNALQQWYIAEHMERLASLRTGAGLLANVLLNLLLIPAYGILGAAWATLLSRAISGFLFNLASPASRPMFRVIMRSLTLGLVPAKS